MSNRTKGHYGPFQTPYGPAPKKASNRNLGCEDRPTDGCAGIVFVIAFSLLGLAAAIC